MWDTLNESTHRLIAFDTERDLHGDQRIRVISIATADLCAVISFNPINAPAHRKDPKRRRVMPKSLVRLLTEGGAIRLCIAGDHEIFHINNDFVQPNGSEIRVANLLDLQLIERLRTRIANRTSLANLVKRYLGEEMSKAQQRSNWRNIPLSEAQIKYSAMDSIYCIELACEIME
jgi:ribonuclease D